MGGALSLYSTWAFPFMYLRLRPALSFALALLLLGMFMVPFVVKMEPSQALLNLNNIVTIFLLFVICLIPRIRHEILRSQQRVRFYLSQLRFHRPSTRGRQFPKRDLSAFRSLSGNFRAELGIFYAQFQSLFNAVKRSIELPRQGTSPGSPSISTRARLYNYLYSLRNGTFPSGVGKSMASRERKHIAPKVLPKLSFIQPPENNGEPLIGRVDATPHPRARVHPGQSHYFRGDVRGHMILGQAVTDISGHIVDVVLFAGHNNDQGAYLISDIHNFLRQKGKKVFSDLGYHGCTVIRPDSSSPAVNDLVYRIRAKAEHAFALVKNFAFARQKCRLSPKMQSILLMTIYELVAWNIKRNPPLENPSLLAEAKLVFVPADPSDLETLKSIGSHPICPSVRISLSTNAESEHDPTSTAPVNDTFSPSLSTSAPSLCPRCDWTLPWKNNSCGYDASIGFLYTLHSYFPIRSPACEALSLLFEAKRMLDARSTFLTLLHHEGQIFDVDGFVLHFNTPARYIDLYGDVFLPMFGRHREGSNGLFSDMCLVKYSRVDTIPSVIVVPLSHFEEVPLEVNSYVAVDFGEEGQVVYEVMAYFKFSCSCGGLRKSTLGHKIGCNSGHYTVHLKCSDCSKWKYYDSNSYGGTPQPVRIVDGKISRLLRHQCSSCWIPVCAVRTELTAEGTHPFALN
jgi:hypothetical protein